MKTSNLVLICETVPKFHKVYPDYRIHIENYNASSATVIWSLRRIGFSGDILFSLENMQQDVKDFISALERLIVLGKEGSDGRPQ